MVACFAAWSRGYAIGLGFNSKDVIDGSMNIYGVRSVSRDHELVVDIFIALRGDFEHVAVDKLAPSIELAVGEYGIEVGEVNPDFNQEP